MHAPLEHWKMNHIYVLVVLLADLGGKHGDRATFSLMVSAYEPQPQDLIVRTINATGTRIQRGIGFDGNLSRTPAGLDGTLDAEQKASEARCRNYHWTRPDYIRWTSHDTPILTTKQQRHDLDTIPPPPLLWAFPGSGAPWLRLVLEHTSGHLTGSVAVDQLVAPLLPGETHGCDRGVLLLHADAQQHKIQRLVDSPVKYVCNRKASNLHDPFAKVVVLVRNPFDTLWECYLREMYAKHDLTPGGKVKKGSSVVNAQHGMLRKAAFEQVEFRARAVELAKQWVEFQEGLALWEKKMPHSTLVVQVLIKGQLLILVVSCFVSFLSLSLFRKELWKRLHRQQGCCFLSTTVATCSMLACPPSCSPSTSLCVCVCYFIRFSWNNSSVCRPWGQVLLQEKKLSGNLGCVA